MTAIATKTFDYSLVTKEDKGKLIYFAAEVRKAKEAHAAAIIETGRLLSNAQAVMANHGDGTFCDWIDKECGLAKRTAYNYISAFEQFGDCATVAQIEPSAMYALAENESAKKVALKLAAKGEVITQKIAKELVKEAKEREPAAKKDTSPAKPKPNPEPVAPTEPTEPAGEPCPNCGGTEWTEDTSGVACAACSHPQGEPLGDMDPGEPEWKTLRQKTVNTINALMRCFDDLHEAKKNKPQWEVSVNKTDSHCKTLLTIAKEW